MTRTRFFAWSFGVLSGLSGGPSMASTGTQPVPPSLGGDLSAYEAPALRSSPAEPTGALTHRDALALALLHNPGLAADSWEVRARESEAIQAGRRPNPELALELENFAGSGPFSGFDGVETTLALSQVIELGGKRGRRANEARLERELANWDYEIRRIDVLTETTTAFVDVLAAQQRTSLADTLVAVAERVLESVSRRVRAGGVSAVEERRARVSVETSRIDRFHAVRALDVARARLVATWGGVRPRFDVVVGALELPDGGDVPSLEAVLARIEASPQIARWTIELDRRQASRDVARSMGVPDLDLGAGIRHFKEDGERALVLGVSVPLPLFDRNRDASAAAERRIKQAHEEQRGALAGVRLALATAQAELDAAASEATALRDRVLPEAELAFTESHEAYSRGTFRLTDVLDAERTAFELRARYVDVLATYHILVAEIERLLGAPLHEDASAAGDR